MRHSQGTGSDPSWSATQSSQAAGLDLHPAHLLQAANPSVLVAAAGVVAVVALWLGYKATQAAWRGSARARRRNRDAVAHEGTHKPRLFSGIGPQAVVALGGVAVSVYGLWGFGTEFARLPLPLLIGFVGVFDAAEIVLFGMLYRAADRESGWSPELRLMHRTAWVQVMFSASMNAVHAPNWWSRPVLAAIPALSAWLIELQLRAKLHNPDAEDDHASPGPLLLVTLLWHRAWSWLFASLGLDARSTKGKMARGALAQKAAQQVYRLRLALLPAVELQARKEAGSVLSRTETKQLEGHLKRVVRQRKRAQVAIDRSDMATDTAQALALVRRLATLVRVEDVALLDCKDVQGVMTMLEELAVVPAAEHIESSARAAEAEAARQRAEDARHEEEAARQRAVAEKEAAREAAERAADARKQEEERQAALLAETAEILEKKQQEEAAWKRAADARERAASEMSEDATKAESLLAQIAEAEKTLGDTLAEAQRVKAETVEASAVLDRLRGDVAELVKVDPAGLPAGGPAFKSEAKEAGWKNWLTEVRAGRPEPTAAELAGLHGVDDGNARNWIRDFRAKHAELIALEAPRGRAEVPRAAAHLPRASRADASEAPVSLALGELINGQRQPV